MGRDCSPDELTEDAKRNVAVINPGDTSVSPRVLWSLMHDDPGLSREDLTARVAQARMRDISPDMPDSHHLLGIAVVHCGLTKGCGLRGSRGRGLRTIPALPRSVSQVLHPGHLGSRKPQDAGQSKPAGLDSDAKASCHCRTELSFSTIQRQLLRPWAAPRRRGTEACILHATQINARSGVCELHSAVPLSTPFPA